MPRSAWSSLARRSPRETPRRRRAHPAASPRAHRRPADGRAGARRRPRARAGRRDRSRRRQLESRRSRGRCRTSTRVETLDARWLARGSGGPWPGRLAEGGSGVAFAPLRSRDQLRAGHPQQRPARGQRRRGERSAGPAAAAVRCSTSRSTTTRHAHTTRQRAPAGGRGHGSDPGGGDAHDRLPIPEPVRAAALAGLGAGSRAGHWSASTSAADARSSSGTRDAFASCRRDACADERARPIVADRQRRRPRAWLEHSSPPCGGRRVIDALRRRRPARRGGAARRSSICSSRATPARCTWRRPSARRSSRSSVPRIRARYAPRGPRRSHRPRRSAVQPLQSHPAPAGSDASATRRIASSHVSVDAVLRLRSRSSPRPRRAAPAPPAHERRRRHRRRSASGRARGPSRRLPPGCGRGSRGRRRPGVDQATAPRPRRRRARSAAGSRYRDDSLWWFAELYLHKQQVVAGIFRTIAALEHLLASEAPAAIEIVRPGVGTTTRLIGTVAPQIAAAAGVGYEGQRMTGASSLRLAAMDARAQGADRGRARLARAVAARQRAGHSGRGAGVRAPRVLATARRATAAPKPYIGPVLTALERRLGAANVSYVSVGPASNFRARRWWHALARRRFRRSGAPIERFAPLARLSDSRRLWRERHRTRRALWASADAAGAGADPRLRLLAAGPRGARRRRAAAVAVVGASDGRSRRRARYAAAARRGHLRGSGRLGTRHRARMPAPPDSERRPAARLHLPTLAQLPARADEMQEDGNRRRLPRPDVDRALRRLRRRSPRATRAICRRTAGRGREPAARCARGRHGGADGGGDRAARARSPGPRPAPRWCSSTTKFSEARRRARARSSKPWSRCRTSTWRSRRIRRRLRNCMRRSPSGRAQVRVAGRRGAARAAVARRALPSSR